MSKREAKPTALPTTHQPWNFYWSSGKQAAPVATLLPGSIHAVNGTNVSVLLSALQQLWAAYPLKCEKQRMEGAR